MPTYRSLYPLLGLLAVACINLPDIDDPLPEVPSADGGDGGTLADGGSDGGPQPGPTDGGVDQTAPAVIRTSPPNGATRVPLDSTVEVDFSEEMMASTLRVSSVPAATFTLSSWVPALRRAVFSASAPLEQERQYTLSVEGTDLAGNALLSAHTFRFTTVGPPDTTAPTLSNHFPAHGSSGHPKNATIQLVFSKPMNRLSVEQSFSINKPQPVTIGSAVWNSEGTSVVFSLTNELPYGAYVEWWLSPNAKDLEGNALSPGTVGVFWIIRQSVATLTPDSYSTLLVSTAAPAQTTPWGVGDNLSNQPYHGFVTFSLFPLRRDFGPDIVITSAQLSWPNSNPSPSTFESLGRFLIEPIYFETSLSTDNSYLYSRPGIGPSVASRHQDLTVQSGNLLFPVTNLLIDAWNDRSSRVETAQFRLRFEATTNHDNTPDTFQIDPSGMMLRVTCEYP